MTVKKAMTVKNRDFLRKHICEIVSFFMNESSM